MAPLSKAEVGVRTEKALQVVQSHPWLKQWIRDLSCRWITNLSSEEYDPTRPDLWKEPYREIRQNYDSGKGAAAIVAFEAMQEERATFPSMAAGDHNESIGGTRDPMPQVVARLAIELYVDLEPSNFWAQYMTHGLHLPRVIRDAYSLKIIESPASNQHATSNLVPAANTAQTGHQPAKLAGARRVPSRKPATRSTRPGFVRQPSLMRQVLNPKRTRSSSDQGKTAIQVKRRLELPATEPDHRAEGPTHHHTRLPDDPPGIPHHKDKPEAPTPTPTAEGRSKVNNKPFNDETSSVDVEETPKDEPIVRHASGIGGSKHTTYQATDTSGRDSSQGPHDSAEQFHIDDNDLDELYVPAVDQFVIHESTNIAHFLAYVRQESISHGEETVIKLLQRGFDTFPASPGSRWWKQLTPYQRGSASEFRSMLALLNSGRDDCFSKWRHSQCQSSTQSEVEESPPSNDGNGNVPSAESRVRSVAQGLLSDNVVEGGNASKPSTTNVANSNDHAKAKSNIKKVLAALSDIHEDIDRSYKAIDTVSGLQSQVRRQLTDHPAVTNGVTELIRDLTSAFFEVQGRHIEILYRMVSMNQLMCDTFIAIDRIGEGGSED